MANCVTILGPGLEGGCCSGDLCVTVIEKTCQDSGGGTSLSNSIEQINGEASPITFGQVVYKTSVSDEVKLAKADADLTSHAIGLVGQASIGAGATGTIIIDGIITISDWTAVIGSVSLTPGKEYFLDPDTAGRMTITPPVDSDVGEYVQSLGTAINATDFRVEPAEKIRI